MVEAPPTEEGWFALHDFRTVDWDAWRRAPERERGQAVEEGVAYLERHEQVTDAPAGDSGVFSVLGDGADLLIVHFRPTLDALNTAERRFEQTAFAEYTERADSYVSVSEVSGYVDDSYFDDDAEVDEGLARYIESKMEPEVPDDGYVSFYPMSKRRQPEQNWYQLPFEERAELMSDHGDVGREYAGKIQQVIASSVGFEEHEWGVTLFGDDPTDIKDIVYEMRFDEASAVYGEFDEFYLGRRFPPRDLRAFLDGEPVPTADEQADAETDETATEETGGGPPPGVTGGDGGGDDTADSDDIREALDDLDIYAGKPHGEDVFATVLYSEADTQELFDEVEGLRGNFEHYGTHVKTAVYAGTETARSAVVSIWDTASAAETAAGFLSDLPGVVARAGEESGFGTMGMFYTVKPEHRGDFVDRFDTVGDRLAEMDGHFETDLLVNHEDENDMFIASQWRAREDAMNFFRSDDFRDTVDWGREILADQPRHVFLA
ncbi:heme-binding protein [Halobaculum sp. MBLA0143]|uniref:heme-binding protein n=1 Tax=Halobaculum sp. MBLA0143 TaxID=3079933 RepID=UPI003525A406